MLKYQTGVFELGMVHGSPGESEDSTISFVYVENASKPVVVADKQGEGVLLLSVFSMG